VFQCIEDHSTGEDLIKQNAISVIYHPSWISSSSSKFLENLQLFLWSNRGIIWDFIRPVANKDCVNYI
jgi:hypothetical protein